MRRLGTTGILLLALAAGCSSGGGGVSPPAQATFLLARVAAAAAKVWPAWSPLSHPGFEVHLPNRFVYHHKDLLALPGNGHPFGIGLGFYPDLDFDGGFGRNWRSTLSGHLEEQPNGDIVVRDHQGRDLPFPFNGAGYDSPDGCWALLEALGGGGWKLTHANRWGHVYDAAGAWTGIERPDGGMIAIERNANGCPTRVSTPEERAVTLSYDPDHLRLVSLTDWAGRRWGFGYDAKGRLVECTLPGGPRWTYGYDAAHRLVRVGSPLGELGVVTYDAGGGATRIASFDGDVLFAPRAGIVEATSRSGVRWDFGLQDGRLAYRAAVAASEVETYEYDAMGRRTREILPSGMEYRWGYVASADPRDLCNVEAFTHRPSDFPANDDHVWSYAWRPGTGDLLTQTSPEGRVTRWEYDAAGNVVRLTPPAVGTGSGAALGATEYAYDAFQRLTEVRHPDGAIDTYAYAATQPRDLKTRVTRDAGAGLDPKTGRARVQDTIDYAYDAVGRVVSENYRDASSVAYAYDERDNLVSRKDENGVTTTYSYDARDNRIARSTPFRDRNGAAIGTGTSLVENTYDRFRRLVRTREHDGFGAVCEQTFAYAGGALPTRIVDGAGAVRTTVHDHRGRPISIASADGTAAERTQTLVWDPCGQLRRLTNGEGFGPTSVFDGYGRELRTEEGDGVVTHYGYDADDRLVSKAVDDAQGRQVSSQRFAYDDDGNLTRMETDRFVPGGPVVVEAIDRTYDLRRRLSTVTDARGAVSTLCWDGVNRIVRREWTEPDRANDYFFDGRNRLVRRVVTHGVTTPTPRVAEHLFTYDAVGRMASTRNPDGAGWDYEHDSLGQVERRTTAPDGAVVDSRHDARGRLLALDKTDGVSTLTNAYEYDCTGRLVRAEEEEGRTTTYAYDPLGRCMSVAINGTTVTAYTYDKADRVRTRSYPGGATITYAYDQRGNVTGRTDGEKPQAFLIDALGRIVQAEEGGHVATRSYDSLGNRLTDLQNGAGVTKTFGDGGTPTRVTLPNGLAYDLTSDAAGRVTQVDGVVGGPVTYEYDPGTHRVARQVHPQMTTETTYDALGRPVRVKNGDQSDWTGTWSRAGLPVEQERADGSVADRRVYDAFDRLLEHDSGSTATGFTTSYAYDAARSRPVTVSTDLPTLQLAADLTVDYDPLGRVASLGSRTYTYGANFAATNAYESRGAYPSAEYAYVLDNYGRVVEVRRKADDSVVASYEYDPFNRNVSSREEEFTLTGVLDRTKFFDGCTIVFEAPAAGSPGFSVYMVPDFAAGGIGHIASGFDEVAFDENNLWERDCRGVPRQLFNLEAGSPQERYDNFDPGDTPHLEFPPGTPFRGTPSLQTGGLLPGFMSSYATGLQLHWSLPPADPGLPRPLPLPGPPPPLADPLPRPQPFLPQPGGIDRAFLLRGGGNGARNGFSCDDAYAALCGSIDELRGLVGQAWDCNGKRGELRLRIRTLRESIEKWDQQLDDLVDEKSSLGAKLDLLYAFDSVVDWGSFVVSLGTTEIIKDEIAKKVTEEVGGALVKAGTTSTGVEIRGSLAGELGIAVAQLLGGFTFEGELARIDGEIRIGIMLKVHAGAKIRELEDQIFFEYDLLKVRLRSQAKFGTCPRADQQLKTASAWRDTRKKKEDLEALKAELALLTR